MTYEPARRPFALAHKCEPRFLPFALAIRYSFCEADRKRDERPVTFSISIDQRFDALVVLEVISGAQTKARICACLCDCGKVFPARAPRLVSGYTKRCKWCSKRKLGLVGREKETQLKYATYVHGAARRNLKWEISRGRFIEIIEGLCFYCGAQPAGGIDRRDNALGYTEQNSVPCCKVCNVAKNNMTEADFFAWLRRIVAHHGEWL